MTLNEYQKKAMSTCMDSCNNLPYMLFNLQGEVGELSSKIAKAIRKDLFFVGTDGYEPNDINNDFTAEWYTDFIDGLKGELGDVLWQLSGLCSVLGFKLEDVAKANLGKLASRKQRCAIDGDGDNR